MTDANGTPEDIRTEGAKEGVCSDEGNTISSHMVIKNIC